MLRIVFERDISTLDEQIKNIYDLAKEDEVFLDEYGSLPEN